MGYLHSGLLHIKLLGVPEVMRCNITALQVASSCRHTRHSKHNTASMHVSCRMSGRVTGTLPAAYSAWSQLKAFELSGTALSGSVPAVYTSSWPSLENFTLDGAMVSGAAPEPFNWTNITWYTLQDTPVSAGPGALFWVYSSQAAALKNIQGLQLGEPSEPAELILMRTSGIQLSHCLLPMHP
jgi:hypothetical protein